MTLRNILIISMVFSVFISCDNEKDDPKEQEYRDALSNDKDNNELKVEFSWYLIEKETGKESKQRSREKLTEAFDMLDEVTEKEKNSTYLAMKGTAAALIASTYGFTEAKNATKYVYLSTQIFAEAEAVDPDDFMLWINRGFSFTGFPTFFGKGEQGFEDLARVIEMGTEGFSPSLVRRMLESLIKAGSELGKDVSEYEKLLESMPKDTGEE